MNNKKLIVDLRNDVLKVLNKECNGKLSWKVGSRNERYRLTFKNKIETTFFCFGDSIGHINNQLGLWTGDITNNYFLFKSKPHVNWSVVMNSIKSYRIIDDFLIINNDILYPILGAKDLNNFSHTTFAEIRFINENTNYTINVGGPSAMLYMNEGIWYTISHLLPSALLLDKRNKLVFYDGLILNLNKNDI